MQGVRWRGVILLMLLTLVMAACGGADSADDDVTADADAPASDPQEAEPTEEEAAATEEEAEPTEEEAAPTEEEAAPTEQEGSDAAVGGPGTPAPQPLEETTEVTLLYTADVLVFGGALLARHFQEFEAENLDVTMEIVPPADGVVLVSQGRADLLLTGVNPGHLSLFVEGAPLAYVAGALGEQLPETESVYVRNELLDEDGNPDPELVRGSSVSLGVGGGGNFGSSGALPVYRWLNRIGVDPNDITPSNVPSMAESALGLVNDQFQVALVLSPAWEEVVDSGCCTRMDDTVGADGVYLASTTWMDEEPEVAEAVFRALMRTHRTYLQGNYLEDPEVVAALSEVLGQPEENVQTLPNMRFSPTMAIDSVAPLIPEYEEMFRFAEVIEYEGNVTQDQAVDTRPVDAVLASE